LAQQYSQDALSNRPVSDEYNRRVKVSCVFPNKKKNRSLLMGIFGVLFFISQPEEVRSQESGEEVFNSTCFACHTIGGGRLVGPDLLDVHQKRSQEWLESFIRSSQSMVDSGDAEAVAIFAEYSQLPMPDALETDEQIRQVINYIETQSIAVAAETPADALVAADQPEVQAQPASEEDIQAGLDLFQGILRFEEGGPACNACHEVMHDAVIGGGILGVELTSVFSRMGGPGVKSILGNSPFPVMQVAYQDQLLTEPEVTALVAFLEYADSEQYNQLPRDYGLGLFVSGTAGAAILFLFFGFVWRGRKNGSVNQAIYDRQIKSVSDD
jgi:mono/diheme cytochrome c family protein